MHGKIDFSQQVKEILNRNNIQIRSLALIDQETKDLFLLQRKKAILLINNKVYEREINSMDNTIIDIFDTLLNPYLKIGQVVLVVLPSQHKKRYVLQAKVQNIFIDRFRLLTLDPRKNKRFDLTNQRKISLHKITDPLAMSIQLGELRVVRETDNVQSDVPETHKASLADSPAGVNLPDGQFAGATICDILYPANEDNAAPEDAELKKSPGFPAEIKDISVGGVCISYNQKDLSPFVDQLLVMETIFKSSDDGASLRLFVLAVVRNVYMKTSEAQANLQFLAKLPKSAEQFFPVLNATQE